jgi:hypothetical protein
MKVSLALVTHTYNPSHSGGRDQKDESSKQLGQIVHKTLSQKDSIQTEGLVE